MNELLDRYINLLYTYRQTVNITGVKSREDIAAIVADAVTGFPSEADVLDLGSGAGIPGIPLKLLNPGISISFCDKARKKMNIVSSMCFQLDIPIQGMFIGDVFSFIDDLKERFSFVVSRGMGDTAFVAGAALPLLKHGGTLMLWKPKDFDITAEGVPTGYDFIEKRMQTLCSIAVFRKTGV